MCADRRPCRLPARQRGLTMIELIMFIVIVSVGIAGILTVMNVVVKASADPLLRKQAIAMAEAILEEVMAKEYTLAVGTLLQSGACTNRATYASVDEYNCFDGTTTTKKILGSQTLSTTTLPLPDTYGAKVAVAATTLTTVPASTVSMKSVTVTVTDPGGATYSLSGYKANY